MIRLLLLSSIDLNFRTWFRVLTACNNGLIAAYTINLKYHVKVVKTHHYRVNRTSHHHHSTRLNVSHVFKLFFKSCSKLYYWIGNVKHITMRITYFVVADFSGNVKNLLKYYLLPLMCIHIYKGFHEKNNKKNSGYPAAPYLQLNQRVMWADGEMAAAAAERYTSSSKIQSLDHLESHPTCGHVSRLSFCGETGRQDFYIRYTYMYKWSFSLTPNHHKNSPYIFLYNLVNKYKYIYKWIIWINCYCACVFL